MAIAGALAWQALRYPTSAVGQPRRSAQIIVERGTTLGEIARRLADRGLIVHPSWFRFYANERGLAQKVKAGQYTFDTTMTPAMILDRLIEGVPVEEVAV